MTEEQRQSLLTKTRNSINTLQAKAHSLKVEADSLITQAQAKSIERLDTLEEIQNLAREFEKLNNPKNLD